MQIGCKFAHVRERVVHARVPERAGASATASVPSDVIRFVDSLVHQDLSQKSQQLWFDCWKYCDRMRPEYIKKLIVALCKRRVSPSDLPPPSEHCLAAAEVFLGDPQLPKMEDIEFVANFVDVNAVHYLNCFIIVYFIRRYLFIIIFYFYLFIGAFVTFYDYCTNLLIFFFIGLFHSGKYLYSYIY